MQQQVESVSKTVMICTELLSGRERRKKLISVWSTSEVIGEKVKIISVQKTTGNLFSASILLVK